jgi:hypothetical protein
VCLQILLQEGKNQEKERKEKKKAGNSNKSSDLSGLILLPSELVKSKKRYETWQRR